MKRRNRIVAGSTGLVVLTIGLNGLACVGASRLRDGVASPTATPSPATATSTVTLPAPTAAPMPSATPDLLPEGARLLHPAEFSSPVEILAELDDLPSGELIVWWKPVKEEGLTKVGYVSFDGEVGELLTVANERAMVIGVGGQGLTLVIDEGHISASENYVVDFGLGELWGYAAGCGQYGLDVGDLFFNYSCYRSGIWDFLSLAPPHGVQQRQDPCKSPYSTTWREDDRIVLGCFGDDACLGQVSEWAPVCFKYSDLGYINDDVGLVETREDGRGQAPMQWRIGFIPLDCIWLGSEECSTRWFEQPMSNLRFSSPGVWLPGSAGLLLLEEPGDDKGVQRLRELDPGSGAMRFIGAYPKPFIDVLDNRGVAIVSPGNQIVVDRRFADEYALLSLEDGTLSPLLGKEGEELWLNSNGLLRVP